MTTSKEESLPHNPDLASDLEVKEIVIAQPQLKGVRLPVKPVVCSRAHSHNRNSPGSAFRIKSHFRGDRGTFPIKSHMIEELLAAASTPATASESFRKPLLSPHSSTSNKRRVAFSPKGDIKPILDGFSLLHACRVANPKLALHADLSS